MLSFHSSFHQHHFSNSSANILLQTPQYLDARWRLYSQNSRKELTQHLQFRTVACGTFFSATMCAMYWRVNQFTSIPTSLGKLLHWLISLTVKRLYELINGIILKCLFSLCSCLNAFMFATHFRHVNYTLTQIEVAGMINIHAFLPHLLEKTCSGLQKYAAWGQGQRIVSRNLYVSPRILNLTTHYEILWVKQINMGHKSAKTLRNSIYMHYKILPESCGKNYFSCRKRYL